MPRWNRRESRGNLERAGQHGNGADSHLRGVRGGAAHLLQDVCSSSPRWVGGECVKSAAFSPNCRRLCIGVAHRRHHARGLEHLCTTRPGGFRASLRRLGSWSVAGDTRAASNTSVLLVRAVSNTSVLLVRAVSEPPALHRLGSWSVAGDTRAVSNTSVLLVRAVSSTSVLLVRAVSQPPSLRRLGSWSVVGTTRAVSNTSVLLVRAVSQPPSLHRFGSWSVAGFARAVSNTSVLLVRAVPRRVAGDARAVSPPQSTARRRARLS